LYETRNASETREFSGDNSFAHDCMICCHRTYQVIDVFIEDCMELANRTTYYKQG